MKWYILAFEPLNLFTEYTVFKMDRSSHRRCSLKEGLLKNFCRKTQRPETCKFIKKETPVQVFFCEIFKNTYFEEDEGMATSE